MASASASVDASAQRQAQADASDVVAAQREQSDSARNRTGMPDAVKTQMESAFGADFSDVRVHASSSQATDLNARAYARGNQIHFAPGEYAPSTTEGQAVLGHELAHVVQQREGRVRPTTQVNGVPVNDDPALEREADAQGRRAATSGGAGFP